MAENKTAEALGKTDRKTQILQSKIACLEASMEKIRKENKVAMCFGLILAFLAFGLAGFMLPDNTTWQDKITHGLGLGMTSMIAAGLMLWSAISLRSSRDKSELQELRQRLKERNDLIALIQRTTEAEKQQPNKERG